MTYTTALIMEWLSSILWPLARVSSLLMVMAVFGSRLAPARVRMGLALAITFLIAPLLPKMPPSSSSLLAIFWYWASSC